MEINEEHLKILEAALLLVSGSSQSELIFKYGLGQQIKEALKIKAFLEK